MECFQLGPVSWQNSQLIYHALAYLGREALVLLSPDSPYVCLGYHQDPEQEVDLEFCRSQEIPVFRREVGGGAVYLDGNQLFYQLVIHKNNPVISGNKSAFYQKFLQPVINAYQKIGIPVAYKPINDIVVNSRKISGNGVGEIGECLVLVGNLILDFDFNMMSRVLKVPDEKFRDKVYQTLTENLTTIRRELGIEKTGVWSDKQLNALLQSEFERVLGGLRPSGLDRSIAEKVDTLSSKMITPRWLHQMGRRDNHREIKIRDGVKVVHRVLKTTGGLIRADYLWQNDRLKSINISGDFFCYPRESIKKLEKMLEEKTLDDVPAAVECFYSDPIMEIPGITAGDWIRLMND
jgi:lipoate-protein ligase A